MKKDNSETIIPKINKKIDIGVGFRIVWARQHPRFDPRGAIKNCKNILLKNKKR